MKINKTIILLSIAIISFTQNCFANDPDIKMFKKCLYPTVMVKSFLSSGSGTIIKCEKKNDFYINYAISCAHVVRHFGSYSIVVYNYEESVITGSNNYDACILGFDISSDIGFISFLSDEPMPTANINIQSKHFVGEDLFSIGCGAGDPPRYNKGQVSRINDDKSNIIISVPTILGDSGSGVFNSQYDLIGIRSKISTDRSNGINMIFHICHMSSVSKLNDFKEFHYFNVCYDNKVETDNFTFMVMLSEIAYINKKLW